MPVARWTVGRTTTRGIAVITADPCVLCTIACTDGATVCKQCPAGTFGAALGLNSSLCTDVCPAGSFSLAGSSACTACPLGRYGAAPGATTAMCSGLCPVHTYGSTTGLTTSACSGSCTAAPGSYCPVGATSSAPVPCPPGTTGTRHQPVAVGADRGCMDPVHVVRLMVVLMVIRGGDQVGTVQRDSRPHAMRVLPAQTAPVARRPLQTSAQQGSIALPVLPVCRVPRASSAPPLVCRSTGST